MDTLFEELDDWAKYLVTSFYTDCGYKKDILDEIAVIIRQTAYMTRPLKPKSRLVAWGLEKSANQAKSLAEKGNTDICHYIEMSIRNKWFTNFVLAMLD